MTMRKNHQNVVCIFLIKKEAQIKKIKAHDARRQHKYLFHLFNLIGMRRAEGAGKKKHKY